MAESEVESILREIRERVLLQQRASQDAAASAVARLHGTNGSSGQPGHSEAVAADSLALIDSYLTTTARTWDRLPPLVSNRSGLVARLELWLKRRIRVATRWFTWEQVNFNAAVHHALRDLLQLLSAYEQELARLRAEITGLRAELKGEAEARHVEFEQHAPRAEMNARLAKLVSELRELRELRERDERLQDQQRVSFKQLSLEASEATVLEDRARRKAEALLEELGRRIGELEKGKE